LARPSKLTPEITVRLCDLIRVGNYESTAARACGIDPATLRRWKSDDAEFRAALKVALAEGETVWLTRIIDGEAWQRAAWYLERRYPERWASDRKKKQADIDIAKAKLAEMKTLGDLIAKAPLSVLDEIIARLRARGPGES
jgi:hypothetical protein